MKLKAKWNIPTMFCHPSVPTKILLVKVDLRKTADFFLIVCHEWEFSLQSISQLTGKRCFLNGTVILCHGKTGIFFCVSHSSFNSGSLE